MTKHKLVTRKEAAEILGISVYTFNGWLYNKRVPLGLAHKEQGTHYYYLVAVEELKKNRHKYFNLKYYPKDKNSARYHTISVKIDATLKKSFYALLNKRNEGASGFLYNYIKSYANRNYSRINKSSLKRVKYSKKTASYPLVNYCPATPDLVRNHSIVIKVDKVLKDKFFTIMKAKRESMSSFLYEYVKSFVEKNNV